jgi:uncharacterized FlaG/YvyC family protein
MDEKYERKFQQSERTVCDLFSSLQIHINNKGEKNNQLTNLLKQFNSLLQHQQKGVSFNLVPTVKKILNKIEELRM